MTEQSDVPVDEDVQATIGLPIPTPAPDLFRHKATDDVLHVLFDNPYERFTIRELARFTDNPAQSVKRAVDVLEANDVIVVEAEGNRRLVGINRDRVSKPDDPVLRIPQSDYHPPVHAALDRLCEELDGVEGILVFGSVARGRADRQSDIDLWVLVDDRAGQQYSATKSPRSSDRSGSMATGTSSKSWSSRCNLHEATGSVSRKCSPTQLRS